MNKILIIHLKAETPPDEYSNPVTGDIEYHSHTEDPLVILNIWKVEPLPECLKVECYGIDTYFIPWENIRYTQLTEKEEK
jgi:hypothetical protein